MDREADHGRKIESKRCNFFTRVSIFLLTKRKREKRNSRVVQRERERERDSRTWKLFLFEKEERKKVSSYKLVYYRLCQSLVKVGRVLFSRVSTRHVAINGRDNCVRFYLSAFLFINSISCIEKFNPHNSSPFLFCRNRVLTHNRDAAIHSRAFNAYSLATIGSSLSLFLRLSHRSISVHPRNVPRDTNLRRFLARMNFNECETSSNARTRANFSQNLPRVRKGFQPEIIRPKFSKLSLSLSRQVRKLKKDTGRRQEWGEGKEAGVEGVGERGCGPCYAEGGSGRGRG